MLLTVHLMGSSNNFKHRDQFESEKITFIILSELITAWKMLIYNTETCITSLGAVVGKKIWKDAFTRQRDYFRLFMGRVGFRIFEA